MHGATTRWTNMAFKPAEAKGGGVLDGNFDPRRAPGRLHLLTMNGSTAPWKRVADKACYGRAHPGRVRWRVLRRTDRPGLPQPRLVIAFNLFKLAAILQGGIVGPRRTDRLQPPRRSRRDFASPNLEAAALAPCPGRLGRV